MPQNLASEPDFSHGLEIGLDLALEQGNGVIEEKYDGSDVRVNILHRLKDMIQDMPSSQSTSHLLIRATLLRPTSTQRPSSRFFRNISRPGGIVETATINHLTRRSDELIVALSSELIPTLHRTHSSVNHQLLELRECLRKQLIENTSVAARQAGESQRQILQRWGKKQARRA